MKNARVALGLVLLVATACTTTVTTTVTASPSEMTVTINGTPTPVSQVGGLATPSVHSNPSSSLEEALQGTQWSLSIVDGGTWPVGDAKPVILSFDRWPPHQLVGFSGCNQYAAHWALNGRNLEVRGIARDQIGCHGQAGWVERRLFRILQASPVVTLSEGELRLTAAPTGVLVFSKGG